MTDPESISSGRSLPVWMKLKPGVDIGLCEDLTLMVPHSTFFYIRYPTTENKKDNQSGVNVKSLTEALKDLDTKPTSAATASSSSSIARKDFPKQHTNSCKKYLSKIEKKPSSAHFVDIKNPSKPFGTNDGFKGPGAACGSSIVKVARQMVSGKRGGTHLKIFRSFPGKIWKIAWDRKIELKIYGKFNVSSPIYWTGRRGSKSLPASPSSSPKSMRKAQANPFFTAHFAANSSGASESNQKGWFLFGLLGIQRDSAISTQSVVSNISEEAEEALEIPAAPSNISQKPLQAKASELREMNFWSPTSM